MPEAPPTVTDDLVELLSNPANAIVARLAKNAIPFDAEGLTLADLVQCDFPGYEPITMDEFVGYQLEQENVGEALSQLLEWEAGVIVTPQNITAVYTTGVVNGVANQLLKVFVLPNPFLMNQPEQTFARQIRYHLIADPE